MISERNKPFYAQRRQIMRTKQFGLNTNQLNLIENWLTQEYVERGIYHPVFGFGVVNGKKDPEGYKKAKKEYLAKGLPEYENFGHAPTLNPVDAVRKGFLIDFKVKSSGTEGKYISHLCGKTDVGVSKKAADKKLKLEEGLDYIQEITSEYDLQRSLRINISKLIRLGDKYDDVPQVYMREWKRPRIDLNVLVANGLPATPTRVLAALEELEEQFGVIFTEGETFRPWDL
jgi:hypothetical protein